MSTDIWKNKKDVVNIHNGILLSHKKETLPLVTTWTDPKGSMLSELSQSKGQIPTWSHLYVESKKQNKM